MTARTSYLLTRSLFVGVLLVIGFVGGWLSARLLGDRVAAAIAPIFGPQAMAPRDTPAALREPFGVFWEAWSIVEHDFYGRGMLDPQRMIRGAISGMLASLDDTYTVYQEPELAAQTNEHMQGRQGGIGTYLRITAGRAFLYKPIRGGPAVAAGLQQDDELLQIDGRDVAALIAGLDVNEAAVRIASHLRGSVGTPVVLQVRRAADGAVVELELTRADVKIPSVEAQLMAGSIGYIRISEFKATTTQEFDEALAMFTGQNLAGMILDLRNNPGGFTTTAREVLGRFYNGIALYEEKGDGVLIELPTIRGEQQVGSMPLVVLVNGGSASASEIIAGALRDARPQSILLGETTYGKGSEQNVYMLSDGGSLRITFAHFLTPARSPIDKIGIAPDHLVPAVEDPAAQAPCVGDRQPAAGAATCADNQLFWAIRLLTDGETPP